MIIMKRFRVLTPEQYDRLTPEKRLAYIEEAIRVARIGRASPRSSGHSQTHSPGASKKAKRARRTAK